MCNNTCSFLTPVVMSSVDLVLLHANIDYMEFSVLSEQLRNTIPCLCCYLGFFNK